MAERHHSRLAPVARDLMRDVPVAVPFWMGVPAAASLLDAAGGWVAPVVDVEGRCVGVFTPADYRRWLAREPPDHEVVSEWQVVPEPTPDEVCYHMNWRFAAVPPGTGLSEVLDRLAAGPDSYLVVLDARRRPQGIVCALDALVAEVTLARAGRVSHPQPERASDARIEGGIPCEFSSTPGASPPMRSSGTTSPSRWRPGSVPSCRGCAGSMRT